MTLIALKEEMDANINNPAYDMDRSFKLFRDFSPWLSILLTIMTLPSLW